MNPILNYFNWKLHYQKKLVLSAICRVCLNDKEDLGIDVLEHNVHLTSIHNIFYLCFPELDLRINSKAALCKTCYDNIYIPYQFIKKWHKKNFSTLLPNVDKNVHPIDAFNFSIKEEIKTEELDLSDTESSVNKNSSNYVFSKNNYEKFTQESKTLLFYSDSNYVDRKYQCSQCKYNAKQKTLLTKHCLNCHSEEKLFKCLPSDYNVTNTPLQLDTFAHTQHKHKCLRCKQSSKNKYNLRGHEAHNQQRYFKCPRCNYTTMCKSLLQSHTRKHTAQQISFKCTHCNYNARTKTDFKKHIIIHTKGKAFKCSYCDFSTNHKTILNSHILIHTRKSFKCLCCEYSTTQKHDLIKHILIHIKDKPFKCSYCNYTTKYKSFLQKHMTIHSQNRFFQCSQCSYISKYKNDLQKHVITHSHKVLSSTAELLFNEVDKSKEDAC